MGREAPGAGPQANTLCLTSTERFEDWKPDGERRARADVLQRGVAGGCFCPLFWLPI